MSIRCLHLGIIWLKTIATEVIATGTTAMAHIVGLIMVTSICISLVGLSRAIII